MKISEYNVCVVGLGYIGLPTSVVMANSGLSVLGVDVNEDAVKKINLGQAHIYEPDLDGALLRAVKSEKLTAQLTPETADVFIVAVPTPFKEGKKPDVSYIEAATKSITPVLKKGDLILLESTSPVGTTEQMAQWVQETRADFKLAQNFDEKTDIHFAYCPERVLPGKTMHELIHNDRVVGGLTQECSTKAQKFYRHFVQGNIFTTKSRMAEMVKLTENASRDVNIAFANELSLICGKLDLDVFELIELANKHPRVNILQPGPGVGGHCIAVDPWFIVDAAPDESQLIYQSRKINDSKPSYVVTQILENIKQISNKKVACLGLSFKPNIDDLRESPSMEVVRELLTHSDIEVLAVEPHIKSLPEELREQNIKLVKVQEALKDAEIVAFLVDHSKFLNLEAKDFEDKKIVDTRGILRRLK